MAGAQLSQVPFNAYPWQANHPYAPGAVVTPTSAPNSTAVNITNSDFTANITGWTAGGSWSWDGTVGYNGTGSAKLAASAGANQTFISATQMAVTPGQSISISCLIGNSPLAQTLNASGAVTLTWYDSTHTLISTSTGNVALGGTFIIAPGVAVWAQSTLTAVAPANAAFVAAGATLTNTTASALWLDAFSWNYASPTSSTSTSTPPQYFTNISAGTSSIVSGNAEPDWTNGGSNTGNVSDSGITWARGTQSIIYWITTPLCQSGNVEPTWPLGTSFVPDGSGFKAFHWQGQAPIIQDANCPQSKYVAIASSKIFAGNNDILNYSATTNPLDWTTSADAGFLPTGLQNYGSNPITAVGLYKSTVAVFNSEGCQIWQTDEDPANMSLLTSVPVGCSYHKTLAPVNDDLFFLAAQGVRSLSNAGTTGGAMNAGDIGMPVDQLVQLGVAYCIAHNTEPVACDFPSYGQYWIHFPGWDAAGQFVNTPAGTSNVFVYTRSRVGSVGAWSRYNFPFPTIDVFCPFGDSLHLRSGDDILMVDPTALYDYAGDAYNSGSRQQTFSWVIEWPYLDLGQPGTSKFLGGIDVIGKQTTNVTVSIGYQQNDHSQFTTPFAMPGDSMPGLFVPMALEAPSFAPRLSGVSTDGCEIEAVILYVDDAGAGI
jgi:hypothetical protein